MIRRTINLISDATSQAILKVATIIPSAARAALAHIK